PRFVAISRRQRDLFLPEVSCNVIHHGLDASAYPLGPGGEHAAFLGRFAAEKGPAVALDIARRAGVRIKLAGKPHWKDVRYHEEEVLPRLDRPGVEWLGEAGPKVKCELP